MKASLENIGEEKMPGVALAYQSSVHVRKDREHRVYVTVLYESGKRLDAQTTANRPGFFSFAHKAYSPVSAAIASPRAA